MVAGAAKMAIKSKKNPDQVSDSSAQRCVMILTKDEDRY